MEPEFTLLDGAARAVGLSPQQALLTPLAVALALWGVGRLMLALGRKAWAGATDSKRVNLVLGVLGLGLALGVALIAFAVLPGPLGFPQLALLS
jgi:hypothetical protein